MSMAYPGITHCSECGKRLDDWFGRCESCQQVTEQVSKSEGKYKLIDILNKIANGELKEGTKVKWDVFEYTYKKGDCYEEYLERKVDNFDYVDILDDMYLRNLNAEVELIEPQEPTDNTKIEELDILEIEDSQNIDNIGLANSIGDLRNEIREIQHKLNEVIRKINKEE